MVSRVERGPVADWFWTIDRLFLITFVLLMGIGLMLSFAASPAVAERLNLDSFHFVKRHAFFMMPALGVMIGLSFLSPRQVRRMAMLILAASLIMMVLVLFIGLEVKGGRRWLSIGSMSIQPSEFMKPAFVVICMRASRKFQAISLPSCCSVSLRLCSSRSLTLGRPS